MKGGALSRKLIEYHIKFQDNIERNRYLRRRLDESSIYKKRRIFVEEDDCIFRKMLLDSGDTFSGKDAVKQFC